MAKIDPTSIVFEAVTPDLEPRVSFYNEGYEFDGIKHNPHVLGYLKDKYGPTKFKATASAKLTGDAKDSCAGWKFGFIQAKIAEKRWAIYRGQTTWEGSMMVDWGAGLPRTSLVSTWPWSALLSAPERCLDVMAPGTMSDIWYDKTRLKHCSGNCGPSGQIISLSEADSANFEDGPVVSMPIQLKHRIVSLRDASLTPV